MAGPSLNTVSPRSPARHVGASPRASVSGFLFLGLALSGCGASTPRCFGDGSPAPLRASPDAPLLAEVGGRRSPPECPRDRPAPGAACALRPEQIEPSELWPSCFYERTGTPCDPYNCTCARASPEAPPTFVCERMVF